MLCSAMGKRSKQGPVIPSIAAEFRGAELGDKRRSDRLMAIAEAIAQAPNASLPKAIGSKSALAGAYRFLSNDAVKPEAVFGPHAAESARRAARYPTVLALHDTTEVEPRGRGGTGEGVGTLRSGKPGYFLHASLLVVPDGPRTPLGLVAAQTFTRIEPPKRKGRKKRLSGKDYGQIPPDEKESFRWLEGVRRAQAAVGETTSLIHVGDRETDKYWLLSETVKEEHRFVYRLCYDRKLANDEDSKRLLAVLADLEPALTIPIEVSRRRAATAPRSRKVHGDRQARQTQVHVAATSVEFERPRHEKHGEPTVRVNVVRVWEPIAPEDGSKQVEWILATTEPVDTPEDVRRIVDYYRARWTIEEYFKALKTGCELESRELQSLPALQVTLAVLIPIAWRLLLLRAIERQKPTTPAADALEASSLEILRRFSSYKLPKRPTVRDALLAIAAMGGHLSNNGAPGWIVLGRGYEKLLLLEQGWLAAQSAQ